MQVWIRSVSKTAETVVNNQAIKEQRKLCDGDTISIGNRAFIYHTDFSNVKPKLISSVWNYSCILFLLFLKVEYWDGSLLKVSKSVPSSRTPFKDAHGRKSDSADAISSLQKPKSSEKAAMPSKAVDASQARSSRFYGTPTRKIATERISSSDSSKKSDQKHLIGIQASNGNNSTPKKYVFGFGCRVVYFSYSRFFTQVWWPSCLPWFIL